MKRLLFLCLSVLFLFACGYHVPGENESWVGGDGRVMIVYPFQNMTSEPYLENFLKDELVKSFSVSRRIDLTENSDAADLELNGRIVDFNSRARAYDSLDEVSEYRSTMVVSARLLAKESGEVLWQREFSRHEDYAAFPDKNARQEAQSLAAKVLSQRLAEDVHAQLLSGF